MIDWEGRARNRLALGWYWRRRAEAAERAAHELEWRAWHRERALLAAYSEAMHAHGAS